MSINLMLQIGYQTPTWVFALFFILLGLGVLQMRTRSMPVRRVFIFPVVFGALSAAGVISGFGLAPLSLVAWALAYGLVAVVVAHSRSPSPVVVEPTSARVQVPGSALPLALMMGIFFLKYFVGASKGMGAAFTTEAYFPVAMSALYGAFSGAFAGRAWPLIQKIQQKRV